MASKSSKVRRREAATAWESMALLALVAVAGLGGMTQLGGAYRDALAEDGGGAVRGAHGIVAVPLVSAQAGTVADLARWGRGVVQRSRAPRILAPADSAANTGAATKLITDVAGVTAERNSTIRAADLPSTIRTRQLPAKPRDAVRVLSLNTANGAKPPDLSQFRSARNRQRIADLLAPTEPDVIGFQEVDHRSLRSEGVNTVVDTVARFEPAFARFARMDRRLPAAGSGQRRRLGARLTQREDGVRLYATRKGFVVFGRSTERVVAWEDRLPEATAIKRWLADERHHFSTEVLHREREAAPYGTAMFVGPRYKFIDAFVEALEPAILEGTAGFGDLLDDSARSARNAKLREGYNGQEPRSALVVLVQAPNGRQQALIGTHLALDPADRAAELRHLARIVKHHSAQGREVVLMGDMNEFTDDVERHFGGAGLKRAAGSDIDQVWVSRDQDVIQGTDFHTEDTSDHKVGAVTTIR